MTDTYYVRIRGRVQGPFPLDKMQLLVRRGQVSRTHEISADGSSWTRAADFPELFAVSSVKESSFPEQTPAAVNEIPVPSSGGDSSTAKQWFYAVGDTEKGPVGESSLINLFRIGELGSDTEVWTDGMSTWKAARDVSIFASLFTEKNYRQGTSSHAISPANLVPVLKSIRFWTMLVAIVGLVVCVVQLISGVILIALDRGLWGLLTVLINLVPGIAYLLLAFFSIRTARFLEKRSEANLLSALRLLGVFWRFVGVLVCIALALLILLIAISLATGQMAAIPKL